MRIHSTTSIEEVKKLRKRGYSINEIVATLLVPKTTVWHYIQNIKIPPKLRKNLLAKRGGSKIRKLKHLEMASNEARKLLGGDAAHYCSLLSMLYWAEGNKRDLTFTNTDPDMIKLFLALMQKIFKLERRDVKVTVRYFTGMSKSACLIYWSKITTITKDQIYMYYNDGGSRGNTPFGICRIAVRRGGYKLKIIQALIKQISNSLPLSFKG